MYLDAWHHFPGQGSTVDHALGNRFLNLRRRHLDRRRPERRQHAGADARGCPNLQALDVFHRLYRLVGKVQFGTVMHMGHQDLRTLELIERILLHILPECATAAFCALDHEGQLEHLRLGKAPGLVSRHGPDDVGHTVLGLVEQLRWRATELHGRIDLALDAVVGFLADLFAPGTEQQFLRGRIRRQKMMDLECDVLCPGAAGAQSQHRGCQQGAECLANLHVESPLCS